MAKTDVRKAAPVDKRAGSGSAPLVVLKVTRSRPREQLYTSPLSVVGVRIAHDPEVDAWKWYIAFENDRIVDGRADCRETAEIHVNARLFQKGYVLPPPPEPSWAHASFRDGDWAGPFASREDAIADGRIKHEGGDFIVAQIEPKPDPCTFVPSDMAQSVIELMRDRAEDSDYIDDDSRWPVVAERDLAKLQRLIEHWADACVEVPFWRVAAGTHEDIPATTAATETTEAT